MNYQINLMNFSKKILLILFILLNFKIFIQHIKCSNDNTDLLNQLLNYKPPQPQKNSNLNKILNKLFNRITCDPSFFQTNTRLHNLNSFTNCNNCRFGIDENGGLFTTKEFIYESKL